MYTSNIFAAVIRQGLLQISNEIQVVSSKIIAGRPRVPQPGVWSASAAVSAVSAAHRSPPRHSFHAPPASEPPHAAADLISLSPLFIGLFYCLFTSYLLQLTTIATHLHSLPLFTYTRLFPEEFSFKTHRAPCANHPDKLSK